MDDTRDTGAGTRGTGAGRTEPGQEHRTPDLEAGKRAEKTPAQNAGKRPENNPKPKKKPKRSRYQGPGCMYQLVNMTVSIMVAGLIGMVIVELLMMHR